MAFKVRPFEEVLKYSKEAIDEALAPIRARAARAKADMAIAKLDEEMVTLERSIFEQCVSKDINFDMLIAAMDRYDLSERKRKQIGTLIESLFPSGK